VVGLAALGGMAAHRGSVHDYLAWNWVIFPRAQQTSLGEHLLMWRDLLKDVGARVALVAVLGFCGAVVQARALWRPGKPLQCARFRPGAGERQAEAALVWCSTSRSHRKALLRRCERTANSGQQGYAT
jgi:hypothetical protein